MNYQITAFSTALFSTWINVEELNLLIDAGDGVSAGLLQKSRKIKHAFITHPDRDHLNGLPQFLQLNARPDFPKVYFPKDCGSFPAMESFLGLFDPHINDSDWIPFASGEEVEIKKNIVVQGMRNEHVKCAPGIHKSLSYKVFEIKRKLKPEFKTLDAKSIKILAAEKGNAFLTEEVRNCQISFSGDTPVDDYEKWNGSDLLIHEATFIRQEDATQIESRGNKHSQLDEVLKMASEIELKQLILTHFSSRYSRNEIDKAIRKSIAEFGIKIPVFAVYPGEIKRDILRSTPVNG